MKKGEGRDSFDPKRRYLSVRQQQGKVQQDSDWNAPRGGRRGGLLGKAILIVVGVVGVGLLGILVIVVAGRLGQGSRLGDGPIASLERPTDGMLVPLHSTLPAIGEGMSPAGLTRLELWVNGQLWDLATFDPATPQARRIWRWTPSGEGEHLLFVRAFDGSGAQADSPIARVLATAQADVRFPVIHTVTEGETVPGLADIYGTDPSAIVAANPGLSPNESLPPGSQITIPMPIPNAAPVGPQSGEAPVPPYSSPLGDGGQGAGAVPANLPVSLGDPPITPGLDIVGGRITPGMPMDLLYLYLSVNAGPWDRLPQDPQTLLEPENGVFDLNPYLAELAATGGPLAVRYHVWGWSGGTLTYLGEGTWTLDPLPDGLLLSVLPTHLEIVGQVRDAYEYVSEWTIPIPVEGYFHGHILDFRWRTSEQGVEDMIWQVSTQPFPQDPGLLPPGIVGGGSAINPLDDLLSGFDLPEIGGPLGGSFGGSSGTPSPYKTFGIDFSAYVDTSVWEGEPESSEGGGFFSGLIDSISLSVEEAFDSLESLRDVRPQRAFNGQLPRTFYIRLVPVMEDHTFGTPSNTVIVRYGPPPSPEVTAESGAAYDAEVITFTHYRAADPDYAGCTVSTQELRYCNNVFGLPNGHIYSYQVSPTLQPVYQDACSILLPEGTLGCGCPGVSCDSGGSDCSLSPSDWGSCIQEGAEWFVEAVKDASNWASDTWEWLKEQAVYVMLEFTPIGWQCQWAEEEADEVVPEGFCHDAMKIALETGMVAMGIPPTLPNFEELIENGKEYAFQMALQELRDSGLACDSICEDALRAGYDYAVDQIESGLGGGGGGNVPVMLYEPHPRAAEQPFTLLIRVERRIDSAGIPDEDLERCGLSILTHAANDIGSVHVEGSPYEGLGLDLPVLPPGEAITIPLILERAPWPVPPGVSPEQLGQGLFEETGVLIGAVIDPATGLPVGPGELGMWSWLYPGSSLEIRLGGPFFGTVSSGGDFLGLPCVTPAEEVIQVPQ